MPGDLPGVDGNEDKEVCECVCLLLACGVGWWVGGGIIITVDPRDGSRWADAR